MDAFKEGMLCGKGCFVYIDSLWKAILCRKYHLWSENFEEMDILFNGCFQEKGCFVEWMLCEGGAFLKRIL